MVSLGCTLRSTSVSTSIFEKYYWCLQYIKKLAYKLFFFSLKKNLVISSKYFYKKIFDIDMVSLEWSATNSCFTLYAILLHYSLNSIEFALTFLTFLASLLSLCNWDATNCGLLSCHELVSDHPRLTMELDMHAWSKPHAYSEFQW